MPQNAVKSYVESKKPVVFEKRYVKKLQRVGFEEIRVHTECSMKTVNFEFF